MFTRKPRLQLEIFAMNGAKRLLQHNRHFRDVARSGTNVCFRRKSGRVADITAMTGFDAKPTSAALNNGLRCSL